MAVNITTDTNIVRVTAATANKVKVVNNTTNTSVTVSQPVTQVVKVVTTGPQGPAGPQGAGANINTGSFATTGSNTFIGNQIVTGSVNISGSLNTNNTLYVSGSSVGIGTATPQAKLDVASSNGYSSINVTTGVNSNGEISFINSGYPISRWTIRGSGAANGSSGTLVFQRLGSGATMTFTENANVLIGTSTDSNFKLDVSGSTRITNGLTVTGSLLQSGSSTFNGGTYLFRANGAGDAGIQIDTLINGYTSLNWASNAVGLGLIAGGGLHARVTQGIGFNIGISTTGGSLGAMLGVRGSGNTSATTAFLVQNSTPTTLLSVRDNGNVGIGTSTPSASLDVSGSARFSSASFAIGTSFPYAATYGAGNDGIIQVKDGGSDATGNYKTQMWFRPAGNVGGLNSNYWGRIEQDSVGFKILPGIYQDVYVKNTTTSGTTYLGGSIAFSTIGIAIPVTTANVLINTATDTGHKLLVSGSGASGSLNVDGTLYVSGSRVGIGTSTPAYRLDVVGSTRLTNAAAQLVLDNSTYSEMNYGPTNYFRANGAAAIINGPFIQFSIGGTERARLSSTSNFLINTTTDTGHKLLVTGSGASGSLNVDGTLYVSGSRVGVGTSTPSASLHIASPGATATDIAFKVRNSANTRDFLVVNGVGDVFNNGAGGVTSNTFFGENSGRATSGIANTFFGAGSGAVNSTGQSNSFFGHNAGVVNLGGNFNSFFGVGAGTSNTGGASNCFFGRISGQNNANGSNNSFFGTQAGRFLLDGVSNLTAIDNSVFVGFDTRANGNSQTNQIVIGYQAIGLGSNTVVLGNDSITTTALKGNVGIGTSTPTNTLDIQSTATGSLRISGSGGSQITLVRPTAGLTGFVRYVGSTMELGTSGADPLNIFTNNTARISVGTTGNVGVGIGAATSGARLGIRGSGATSATTTFLVENSTPSTLFSILDNGNVGIGPVIPSASLHISGASSAALLEIDSPAVNNILFVSGSGRVGIGTATPAFTLDVNGIFGIGTAGGRLSSTAGNTLNADFGNAQLSVGNEFINLAANGSGDIRLSTLSVFRLLVKNNGNILIGTTTDAGFKLDVSGSTRITNGLTVTGSLIINPTGSFVLPLSQSSTPQTGSAYWSGSLLYVYNGTRYMSASFS